MVQRLDPAAATALLASLPQWRHDSERDAISREFVFGDFREAFAFMTQLALAAEKHDHHPEWFNVYNKVRIIFTTHDANGLSQRDIDMATIADRAYARYVQA